MNLRRPIYICLHLMWSALSMAAPVDCAPSIKDNLKSLWKPALPKQAHLGMDANPKTMQLYNQLDVTDKVELTTALKNYQLTHQVSDAQMLERAALIQQDCLSKGALQRGCLYLRISDLKKQSQMMAEATGSTLPAKPLLSMSQRFLKFAKNTPRRVKVGTKKYVRDVIRTKGKRLFVKYRKQGQSKNPFKNPMGYLNSPIATVRDAKWQVTTPVSIMGFMLLVDIPLSILESKAQQHALEEIDHNKSSLIGGEYLWSFLESGILPQEAVLELYYKHNDELDQWLNNKLAVLPRLEELSKILKLTTEEKNTINSRARELYLTELAVFLKKHPDSTDEQRIKFHEEVEAKFFEELKRISSLNRLEDFEIELLSTAYYPVVMLEDRSDLSVTHYLLKNSNGSTKETFDRLQEGLSLPLAMFMTLQQQMDPGIVSKKIQQAKTQLPADLQNVARRPDLPFLDFELKLSMKPGGETVVLSDEISRWNVLSKDPRFEEVYTLYKQGDLDQYTAMEYFEQAAQAFNEVNDILAQKQLTPALVEQTLGNRFFSSVKEDLEAWRKLNPQDSRFSELKLKAVEIWLNFHRDLAAGKRPDINHFTSQYQALFQ